MRGGRHEKPLLPPRLASTAQCGAYAALSAAASDVDRARQPALLADIGRLEPPLLSLEGSHHLLSARLHSRSTLQRASTSGWVHPLSPQAGAGAGRERGGGA